MRRKTATLGIGLLGLTMPMAGGTEDKAAAKKETAVVWSLRNGKCHDDVSDRSLCLEKSKKDRVRWGITNNCKDAVFAFTLKDPEPVTNCTITPAQPTFSKIQDRFAIKSGGSVVVQCVVYEDAAERECDRGHADKYEYAINIVKGGDEQHIKSGRPIMMSHELDIGVNP